MKNRRRIYEGKAKILYEGPEPGTLVQFFKDDATAFNNWLVRQTTIRDNFHVIDWNRAASQHPGWFLADGLHLNQTGQNGYAAKIDRVVARVC